MLKRYLINGKEYQYEEKEAPAGAIPVEQKAPAPVQEKKKAEPLNKSVTPKNKAVKKS